MKNKIDEFTKEVVVAPAFDKRSKDPSKNYGIHGCDMRFVLSGKKGAVQFVIYTNWQLPHVENEFLKDCHPYDAIDIKTRFSPLPADVGYHSPKPTYKGQEVMTEKCPYLGGNPCYYDGSRLEAENVYKILVAEGSDGVWKYLENYYNDIFERRNGIED